MIDSVPAGIAAAGFEFLDGAPERDALRPYCAILDVYDQKRRTRSDPGRAAETGRLVTPDFLSLTIPDQGRVIEFTIL